MEEVIKMAKFWLVEHSIITNFEWKRGTTIGASLQFLFLTILSYVFVTLILYRYSFRPSSFRLLRLVSASYNVILFSLSLLMVVGCSLSTLSQMPDRQWLFCFPANRTPTRGPVFFWGYVFYLSKILEFTDTLLIFLGGRSSSKRLSFLHVFHHSMVMIMCYIWVDTPQSLLPLGVITNSAVHTVMYGYYLMCSVGIRPSWKKMVTNLQITQFVWGFLAAGVTVYYHLLKHSCSGLMFLLSFNVTFNASLLVLFLDFYSKSYKIKNQMITKDGDHRKCI